MASGLIPIIKMASQNAEQNAQPTDLRFGTVTSVNPLKVQITTQLTIPSSALVVPEHLTNHTVTVGVSWRTENTGGGSGESAYASHLHGITGQKELTIYNALKKGDKVALLRARGGQTYYILDRV